MLEIEPGAEVVEETCDDCNQLTTRVTAFVRQDGDAYAVYFASCYHPVDGHEVWINAVFSPTWEDEVDDHFTFGCRVGPVEGQDGPAASLVPAASAWDESRVFGRKLSRDEALAHPMLGEFWSLVDHILMHDQVISTHIYGQDAVFDLDCL